MSMTHHHGRSTPSQPWTLILGGTTTYGRNLAERAIETTAPGVDIVWFDGSPPSGIPRESETRSAAAGELILVEFGDRLESTLLERLTHPPERGRVRMWLWHHFGRRLGAALRPLNSWLTIKSDLRRVSEAGAPISIMCCDETAITSAWKATRRWPKVPVATGWKPHENQRS